LIGNIDAMLSDLKDWLNQINHRLNYRDTKRMFNVVIVLLKVFESTLLLAHLISFYTQVTIIY